MMNWKVVQDIAYDICTGCSAAQRTAHRWRDASDAAARGDPAAVAAACRAAAELLLANANKIEALIEREREAA